MSNLGEALWQEAWKEGFKEGFIETFEEEFIKTFKEEFEEEFAKTIEEEFVKGFEEGKETTLLESISNLMETAKVSAFDAMSMLKVPEDIRQKYIDLHQLH